MGKGSDGFFDLDPAVAAIIGRGEKKREEARLPKAERKSVIRERSKAEARRGKRALYDLPEDLIRRVQRIAEENETSASQVAKLAISIFLQAVESGEVDIRVYRSMAKKNPRYTYCLDLKK